MLLSLFLSPQDGTLALTCSQSKLPDVLCCCIRDASPCSGRFGLKQVTGTSGRVVVVVVGGGKGQERVLVTLERSVPADRRDGENPFYTTDKIQRINGRDLRAGTHTRTHTHVLEMVTLNQGPYGLVGGTSHMIAPQRSSAVCHSNSVWSSWVLARCSTELSHSR